MRRKEKAIITMTLEKTIKSLEKAVGDRDGTFAKIPLGKRKDFMIRAIEESSSFNNQMMIYLSSCNTFLRVKNSSKSTW